MAKEKKTIVKKEKKETPVVTEEMAVAPATENKANNKGFFYGFGRRKTATARARLYLPTEEIVINGTKLNRGDIYVNNQPIDVYFNDRFTKAIYTEVYRTTNTVGRFITTIVVSGSGATGQSGAAVLAISRALCAVDPKFKATLRKKGFMTRDPRMKERKKPGLMGARKQKSSPKR